MSNQTSVWKLKIIVMKLIGYESNGTGSWVVVVYLTKLNN